jgi:phosphocarrier protein FPr
MKQIEIVIHNRTGLHARPAKVLVNLAKQFQSTISLQHKGKKANAKSMVSVLTLGAVSGSDILVQAEGIDEEKAIAELEAAILAGLGDEDGQPEPEPKPIKTEVPAIFQPVKENLEPGVIKGVGAAPGIAVGPVFHFQQVEFNLEDPETLSANGRMELS